MLLRKLCLCLLFLIPGTPAWAGVPVERTMICPVGGKTFTITGTASCTTFGRTMSFRPVTSCEFVTRLPVCPSSGLPVYQEFTEVHVSKLTSFVETADYAALKNRPPWQRAYGLSVHLGQSGTATAFSLLLNAMWYETDSFFAEEAVLNDMLREAEFEMERASVDSRPFLNAILAYALAYAGRTDESVERLTRAKQAKNAPDHLKEYISAVEACQADVEAPNCRPDAAIAP